MDDQIISAIQIAYNPSSDPTLKRQAFDYVNQLRQEPSAWQPCLTISLQVPRQPMVIRVFCLDIVNNALQAGLVDQQGLRTIKDRLMEYLGKHYGSGSEEETPDPGTIVNKFAQTITFLFASFYGSGWETCFDDLLALTTKGTGSRDSYPGVVFYLTVLNSVHDEIGDQLLSRSRAEQDRANTLKDLIRERDVQKIARSWEEILSQWRTSKDVVAELCLKAVGKWVSWVDISFVVNQRMLELLFQQLERAQKVEPGPGEELARDAAVDVFTETVAKKMPTADKIDMITFLNLETVVSQLVTCPPLSDSRAPNYDVDLAETVAKLVNTTVTDIVRVLDTENQASPTWAKAEQLLAAFLPHLLRFFSDVFDEVCSTVLTAMNDVLAFLRKASTGEAAAAQRAAMLLPILKAIFIKMRYDDTADWNQEDEQTDEAEFQDLRKRLAALQSAIAAADEALYVEAISTLVHDTLQRLRTDGSSLNWRDLDLALYEVYLMGDLAAKGGGLYHKNKPNSPAAEALIQMMLEMVQSNAGSFGHPAIQLQYMEICVRYSTFFEKHTGFIEPVLQTFLELAHHQSLKVKARAWYLIQRLVRQLRTHLGNATEAVVQSLQDLLVIRAELPSEEEGDDMSSDGETATDSTFTSQLYLFEAVGCICGSTSAPPEKQAPILQLIMQPLFSDIERNLESARAGNDLASLQVHHSIMALGTIARGFSEFTPGADSQHGGAAIAPQVKQAFAQVAEVTLVTLTALKSSFQIRTAARFAFSRLIGIVGTQMMQQLPQWVEGLLTESSTRDEMALFLRLLDQVIFGFKNDISDFLDRLFSGLLQRVFVGISAGTSGTDDEIELAELKREYLNFLMVILGNDLGTVLVSSTNQPIFESIITSTEHLARDVEDFPTAKMAFLLLSRMCTVWGGPDVVSAIGQVNGNVAGPQPALPGFDQFMITRFSPLCWALPTNPSFNSKDAQARQALSEAAGLQKTIYTKTGQQYLTWLQENELRTMGMNDTLINEYLQKLATLEPKAFKTFFAKFIAQGGQM
ncbi:armadillo-type protein [Exophiala viscosa]|uniref:armadillo-type protein n=1 Tax=Exophiala viscosa TaxID=2486360 RepID=UPI00219947E5|nr:armadillo-type protein [Exophiala viscosa]